MKVKRFSPMLRAQGFHVIHYGVAGAESGANEQVDLMTQEEHLALLGRAAYHEDPSRLIGVDANDSTSLYKQFNFTLKDELDARLEPGDIICIPFGPAHERAYRGLDLVRSKQVAVVETGIGYADTCSHYRVFESESWRHYQYGRDRRFGASWNSVRLEWVIPNYYDPADWPLGVERDASRIVYLGRLEKCKGLELIPWLAERRPDLTFQICGQGDPTEYLTSKNIEYIEPISGKARATFLGSARAVLCPSRYLEPFCGVAVEAMLCGTPAITSDFGAFTETIKPGLTGLRCRTREAFLKALDDVVEMSNAQVRRSTVNRYSMSVLGHKYAAVFNEVCAAMPVGV